eukprot:10050432-Alexandrium_andersonii.AAC.2
MDLDRVLVRGDDPEGSGPETRSETSEESVRISLFGRAAAAPPGQAGRAPAKALPPLVRRPRARRAKTPAPARRASAPTPPPRRPPPRRARAPVRRASPPA